MRYINYCIIIYYYNKAIIRERHPILTVEELLHDLNGSTMFSRIDIK